MKNFEDFVKKGIVKIKNPNKSLARDLCEEAERKYKSLKENLNKVGMNENNANDIIKSCYDILLYLIRAKLCIEGFKSSGEGSHEAEVSYLLKLNFSENEAKVMDELRYFRNGIKYYGKRFGKDYAKHILGFLNKNYMKLRKLIEL